MGIQRCFIALLLAAGIATGIPAGASAEFFNETQIFLGSVVKDGRVDYAAIQRNRGLLEALVETIANYDLREASAKERKAFWINAYNLLVIDQVVEAWPIRSTKDVRGFFDGIKVEAAGEEQTLNDIEAKHLLQAFDDPRLHFVLVCAAMGCPRIITEAYRPQSVESQVERRTRIVLNDPEFIRVDPIRKRVEVSQIFKWYSDEFLQTAPTILAYINTYRSSPIPADFTLSYYPYDWSLNAMSVSVGVMNFDNDSRNISGGGSNLQVYTPSALFPAGQYEYKLFNNLYTQTSFYDADGEERDVNERQTYFTMIHEFFFGISPRVNIGIDLYLKSARFDDEDASPLEVLSFAGGPRHRSALSWISPKVKVAPFASLPGLSLQSTWVVPLAHDLEGQAADNKIFLEFNDAQWWIQIFYDLRFNEQLLLFAESGILWRIDSATDEPDNGFQTPLKLFLNYFPGSDATVYLSTQFTPDWGEGLESYFTQAGLGAKYQLTDKVELEILYTRFPLGKNAGAGETYNFGLRFIN